MIRKTYIVTILLTSVFWASFAYAQTASISFNPKEVHQGEPLMIQVNGVASRKSSLTEAYLLSLIMLSTFFFTAGGIDIVIIFLIV